MGKVYKTEQGAWGTILHRITDAGNDTTNYKNFFDEDVTEWEEENEYGDRVKYTQYRKNGKIINGRSKIIERAKRPVYISDHASVDDDEFELQYALVGLMLKIFGAMIAFMLIAVICFVIGMVVSNAVFAICLISLGAIPVKYVVINILNHNLFSTYRLSLKLRKKIYQMEKIEKKYKKNNDVEKFQLKMDSIIAKTNYIAEKLQKKLYKKNAVGLEEVLVYYYKKNYMKIGAGKMEDVMK